MYCCYSTHQFTSRGEPTTKEPLVGPYAAEALQQVDIGYLTNSLFPNQLQQMDVDDERYFWLRIADYLKVAESNDPVPRLRSVQEHIAARPLNKRCPCNHGAVMVHSSHHLVYCNGRARQQVVEQREQAERIRRERAEEEERHQKKTAQRLAGQITAEWTTRTAEFLSEEMLRQIEEDCRTERHLRYSLFCLSLLPYCVYIIQPIVCSRGNNILVTITLSHL